MEGVVATWLNQSYKKQFEEYIEIKRRLEVNGLNTDVECDPTNVEFENWLASKFYKHKIMDWYTKNALWLYSKIGNDEDVLTYDEFFDLKEENLCECNEIAEIFMIETDIFDFETPLCKEFKEFNHLLHIDLEEYWRGKKENEESSEDAWSNNLPNDEWEHCEETTYIKSNANYNYETYNKVCQMFKNRAVINNNNEVIQANQEWFDEHEPIGDDDDDDDMGDLDDYLILNDAPYYVDERKKDSRKNEQITNSGWSVLAVLFQNRTGFAAEPNRLTYIQKGIVNGDSVSLVASASVECHIPPNTAEQKLARKNELKAKITLMLAIPDEHLLKFHACKDAKSLWEAIKKRFGGNNESKKMNTILKQNYENFAASSQEEDANLKLLRSLPSAWNNIALIMRNKFNLDTLSMDDLYNNMKVYKSKIKSQSSSSLNSQNVAFVSSDNSSGTNETVNTAHIVSAASSKYQASTASYADDVMFSFFSNQSNAPQLDNGPRNQGNRNKDAPTRNAPVDISTTNALVVQDGIDKTGLGYDCQINESDLNDIHVNESKVLNNVFDSRESDGDDNQVNDRFKKGKGYHAVPPSYVGNYMPPRADLSFVGLNNSVFKSKVSKTINSVPKMETNASKTNNEDENVFKPKEVKKIVKPILEKIEFVNGRNTTVENVNKVEKPRKFSQSPRDNEDENVFKPKEVKKIVKPILEKIEFVNGRNTTVENVNKVEKPRKFSQSPRDYQEIDGGVAFGGNAKGRKIIRKGKIRTKKLDLKMCIMLLDESQVMLKVPRNNNMYSFDLKNVVPVGGLTWLFLNATLDESNLWHRRLGHINFKTMNKLVRGNLVRGLPSKLFKNDHTCAACQKRKQHKASCIENQMDHKVKTIRCDNETEIKNRIMNGFCEIKGIRREFSVARTPQQNGVAERKNKTLIEAARTMLTDSKLPTTIWVEAVNTACYVQNRVLVIKPHNKTPYELFLGRKPALSFMRPFGCLVTILNTLDHLGQAGKKIVPGSLYVLLPLLTSNSQGPKSSEDKVAHDAGNKRRERAQKNEFESMFGQDKDANTYRMFTPIIVVGSSYVNHDRHAHTFLVHESTHQSCESCVVAAATVEDSYKYMLNSEESPLQGFAVMPVVLKPKRLKVDKARIRGWNRLPPFQYRLTRSERDDRNVLVSVRNETRILSGILSG
uniref:Ribonuclease H-like domain-containing protein n=1 Tax=Tanacetum cinerariifolium TaxID=118510 RepID=A0A6L2LCN9_TANCI|nr:ribonuclease H-like domain-containing protein [Tanacetum cinerariifolium]